MALGGCKCADPRADAAAQREADLSKLPQSPDDQLALERASRPGETPTLEALTAGLAKEGVTFNAPRQPYGRRLLALYCGSVDSTNGMIITVCEYPSPEQALRGEVEAKLMGQHVAGYQSRVRKKSVLQLITRSDTPPEHVTKVFSLFEAL